MATLSAPTLERLLKEVRIFLNQPDSSNSTWSNEELTLYLNDGVRTFFAELSDVAEGQFDKMADLDITANQETVTLPTDFFKVKALYKALPNEYQILSYQNNLTEGYATDGGNSSNSFIPAYYFRGNSLVLRPVPTFSQTAGLRLEYTAFPDTMIWGGDTMTSGISPIFKELVVVQAAYKAKLRDEMNNGGGQGHTVVGAHLADLYKTFKETVTPRSHYPQFTKPFNP